jgi:purine-binding chemotaxis protein CheW
MKGRLEVESESGRWVTFFLADEVLAVRVEDVQEVLHQQPLTPVPLAPGHILGLLNLRGQIMPAVDLRKRLGFPPREATKSSSLLVVKTAEELLSVVVDDVGDVMELPQPQWKPPPDTLPEHHRTYIFGICPIEGHVVLGLRAGALGGDEQRGQGGTP